MNWEVYPFLSTKVLLDFAIRWIEFEDRLEI